jgi:hypothetical protein
MHIYIHTCTNLYKDGLRIRLPDPSEMPKTTIPRMDYATKVCFFGILLAFIIFLG